MTNTPPPTTANPQQPLTRRDLQRIALRDLVALATESATTETQVERKYQSAVEAGKKEQQRLTWEIDDRLKAAKEKVEVEYREKLAAAQRQFNAELNNAKAIEAKGRQRFDHDHKTVERDVKGKYDHACWLAESVFDATQIGLREEMKATKERVETWNEELDGMEARARDALILYGHFPPPPVPPSTETLPPAEDTKAGYEAAREAARSAVTRLATLALPRMLVGFKPIFLFILGLVIAAAIVQLRQPDPMVPDWKKIGIACGIAAGVMIVGGIGLKLLANSQVRKNWAPARNRLDMARAAVEAHLEHEKKVNEQKHKEATERRQAEEQAAKERFQPMINQSAERRKAGLAAVLNELNEKAPKIEAARAAASAEIEQWHKQKQAEVQHRYEREVKALAERIERHNAATLKEYNDATAALQQRLGDGLANIQAPIEEKSDQKVMAWDDPAWADWTPPKKFASTIPIGHLTIDLRKIADSVPRKGDLKLQLPEPFKMTASLGFPAQASLLIETDRAGRAQAIETVQMVMARLLTTLPAGRVKFTLIDPVGLGQNFAGFMHLADHDDSLVGGRIWTESEQIEQRLADLTEHMETVIQKYLRNEYETIDDYNAQAGELAEPYRFLVVNDFPTGFQGEAFRRLSSISSSGARCGVYTLVIRDTRQPLPSEMHIEDVQAHSVTLEREEDRFVWKDETFREFPLALDPPPAEEFLTRTLDVVGRYAKLAKRVEVPFDSIAPRQDDCWTRSTADELTVPVGRMGATRLQELRLGKGVAQHVIIAGKTGSGKSTLLHAIVTNLAMWYSPDEVEFYLVDFKKGVEFKTYATHDLPHARAVAVESDREFGLSVLQRLDAELTRRGELFRKLGIQDLPQYRTVQKERGGNEPSLPTLPRTLLMIDEFQEFFTEDDKLAQDAALLLDRLVRQGRAFGVHVILGSQTIGGSSGLSRATIGQMAVRVALQTSEADSQLILGDGNSAARLLTRPGEAIYNDAGGLVEANSPFQVAWLNDDQRDRYLDRVTQLATRDASKRNFLPLIVFEGNAPADILQNRRLQAALASDEFLPAGAPAVAWVGDPVAIKDPSGVALRRQSGANVIFIGQQDESAQAMMATMMLSIAAQQSPASAQFHVMDGTPADSPFADTFPRLAQTLPHDVKMVEYRAVGDVINDLTAELARRQAADDPSAPSIYVFVYGLQRYRTLRKGEDDSFSFSMSEEEKKPNPGKQFADLLREGPPHGIHVIAFADTPATVERTFERNTLREFDTRILFQMSANDSSNLIDSPAANRLGFNRALAFSEEQGTLEKFRPYALPPKEWLERYRERLAAKASPARSSS